MQGQAFEEAMQRVGSALSEIRPKAVTSDVF